MKRILVLLLLLGAARAGAAPSPRDEARRLFSVASDAFGNGFYAEALEAFEEAFRLSQKPELQFNIGLCLEHMGKEREAAAAYRQYLALGATRDRKGVERRAAALEALVAARERPAAPAPVAAAPSTPPPERPRTRALRLGTIGAAAATAALAITAAGLTIGAASHYHDLVDACRGPSGCDSDARDAQTRLNVASDVMWGLAAAGAITTVTLALLARRESRLRAAASLLPRGGAAASLAFAF
jgi:tetratricopeptide (TPR) repeat protein